MNAMQRAYLAHTRVQNQRYGTPEHWRKTVPLALLQKAYFAIHLEEVNPTPKKDKGNGRKMDAS